MIFVLIAVIAVFVIVLRQDDGASACGGAFVTGLLAAFVFLLVVPALFLWIHPDPYYTHSIETDQIVSVSDSSSIHDQISGFLVVEGYVNSELDYTYYRKLADGGLQEVQIPVDDTTVYEDATASTAHVDWYNFRVAPVSWTRFLLMGPVKSDAPSNWSYVLHVPKDTIKESFALNGGGS